MGVLRKKWGENNPNLICGVEGDEESGGGDGALPCKDPWSLRNKKHQGTQEGNLGLEVFDMTIKLLWMSILIIRSSRSNGRCQASL